MSACSSARNSLLGRVSTVTIVVLPAPCLGTRSTPVDSGLIRPQVAWRRGLVGAVQGEQLAALRAPHPLDPVVPLSMIRQRTLVALVGGEHLQRVLARERRGGNPHLAGARQQPRVVL